MSDVEVSVLLLTFLRIIAHLLSLNLMGSFRILIYNFHNKHE